MSAKFSKIHALIAFIMLLPGTACPSATLFAAIKLTKGMRLSISASDFDLDSFNSKPKLFAKYTDASGKVHLRPLKVDEKKSAFRKDAGLEQVNVIWPLTPAYLDCAILLKTGKGEYETSDSSCQSIPPHVDNVVVQADNSFIISGYYFSGEGKIVFEQSKKWTVRPLRPFEFSNRRGKAKSSLMNLDTGQFRFSINPPKKYDSTESATLTIINKLGSHSFQIPAAQRSPNIISITVSPDASGSTSPTVGQYTLIDSTPVAISAETTSIEYQYFKQWTSNDPNLVIEAPLSKNTYIYPSGTLSEKATLTAIFAGKQFYKLSVDPEASGTTTPEANLEYEYDEKAITLKARANPGFVFSHWESLSDAKIADSTSPETPLELGFDGLTHIKACFVKAPETITFSGIIFGVSVYDPGTSSGKTTLKWKAAQHAASKLENFKYHIYRASSSEVSELLLPENLQKTVIGETEVALDTSISTSLEYWLILAEDAQGNLNTTHLPMAIPNSPFSFKSPIKALKDQIGEADYDVIWETIEIKGDFTSKFTVGDYIYYTNGIFDVPIIIDSVNYSEPYNITILDFTELSLASLATANSKVTFVNRIPVNRQINDNFHYPNLSGKWDWKSSPSVETTIVFQGANEWVISSTLTGKLEVKSQIDLDIKATIPSGIFDGTPAKFISTNSLYLPNGMSLSQKTELTTLQNISLITDNDFAATVHIEDSCDLNLVTSWSSKNSKPEHNDNSNYYSASTASVLTSDIVAHDITVIVEANLVNSINGSPIAKHLFRKEYDNTATLEYYNELIRDLYDKFKLSDHQMILFQYHNSSLFDTKKSSYRDFIYPTAQDSQDQLYSLPSINFDFPTPEVTSNDQNETDRVPHHYIEVSHPLDFNIEMASGVNNSILTDKIPNLNIEVEPEKAKVCLKLNGAPKFNPETGKWVQAATFRPRWISSYKLRAQTWGDGNLDKNAASKWDAVVITALAPEKSED